MSKDRKKSFMTGFFYKLAESRIDPKDLNDMLELTKIASPTLMAAGTLGIATPVLLKALADVGFTVPNMVGKSLGGNVAEQEAEFDPNLDSLETEKLIRDYERQIQRLKAKKQNKAVSQAKKG